MKEYNFVSAKEASKIIGCSKKTVYSNLDKFVGKLADMPREGYIFKKTEVNKYANEYKEDNYLKKNGYSSLELSKMINFSKQKAAYYLYNYKLKKPKKVKKLNHEHRNILLKKYLNDFVRYIPEKYDIKEEDNKMKGVEKFEVEIADKAVNKEGVVDALMKRYHVCEEVAEAMIWDSLCTVKGLEYLFNDLERNSKLERVDLDEG